MRPRFEMQLPVERKRWLGALESLLETEPGSLRGQVFRKHAVIQMHDGERTFWSPYLNLEVEDEPDGSAIRGRFSPHPNVWTMFLAAYGFLLLGAVFSGVFGLVQLSLGLWPWGLVLAGSLLVACAGPYAGSLIGQRLAIALPKASASGLPSAVRGSRQKDEALAKTWW